MCCVSRSSSRIQAASALEKTLISLELLLLISWPSELLAGVIFVGLLLLLDLLLPRLTFLSFVVFYMSIASRDLESKEKKMLD